MKRTTIILITLCLISQLIYAQNPTISGNLWAEDDANFLYDGEDGNAGIKVYLKDFVTGNIVDSTITSDTGYTFPSSMDIVIQPGDYFLEIPTNEFEVGGNLQGLVSCFGFSDANNGIDNDDNGMDNLPLTTSSFTVGTSDIEYVDLCFFINCSEENDLASGACNQVQDDFILCEISTLGTFCNSLPSFSTSGNQPDPICPGGGTADNMSWFGFVAYGGSYEIVLNPQYCQESANGTKGMEMGIYTDCSFSDVVFCSSGCSLEPIVVESSLLVPGQTYYMFLDGCDGSVCTYDIDINGTPLPPDLTPQDLCIVDNQAQVICEDYEVPLFSPVTFEATEIDINAQYTWEISTISGEPYFGPPMETTDQNTLNVFFETTGEYSVCLTSIENGCQAWTGNLCRTITVMELEPFGSPICDQIEEEEIICGVTSLHNKVGIMSAQNSPGNQPNPLCPGGGAPHNITWFAFVADEGEYSITITPTGCTGSTTGQEGVQMGIYTDCTFSESVYCDPNCSTDPLTVDSDDLEAGETYYFFIDGCSQSVCSFEISISGTPIPASPQIDEICYFNEGEFICDDAQLCPNDTTLFEVTSNYQGDAYNWEITALSGGPYTGNASPQTESSQLEIAFENEGTYLLCIKEIEDSCFDNWNGNVCRYVTVDENFCPPCDNDTTPPVVQAVSLSTAVIGTMDEVKIYAIDFFFFAQDNCSPEDSLLYSFNAQGPEFDDHYDESVRSAFMYLDCCNVINSPEGIEIFVLDLEGNVSGVTVFLTVLPPVGGSCDGCENDTIAPEIEVFESITWLFPQDSSEIEIWASDFVTSGSDNCSGPSNLKYSFSPTNPFEDSSAGFITFLCEEVENSPFELPIYVWDKNGNFSVDTSTLILQPAMGLDCSQFNEEISGTILDLDNSPIEGVSVYLETANGEMIESVTTDASGSYSLFANPINKYIRIEYQTPDMPVISILDLMLIQHYLLGLIPFSTPQILASDINADGEVRVNDLRLLRNIIFGIVDQNEYLGNSWQFSTMDGDRTPVENNRFPIEQTSMPNLIGYRIGDIR